MKGERTRQAILALLQERGALSARQLAEAAGLGLRTVQQHLAGLVKAGRVHRQGGQPCLYALDRADFWRALPAPPVFP